MSFIGENVIKGLRSFRDALRNPASKLRDALRRPGSGFTVVRVGDGSFRVSMPRAAYRTLERLMVATGISSMGETLRAALKWYKEDQAGAMTAEQLLNRLDRENIRLEVWHDGTVRFSVLDRWKFNWSRGRGSHIVEVFDWSGGAQRASILVGSSAKLSDALDGIKKFRDQAELTAGVSNEVSNET